MKHLFLILLLLIFLILPVSADTLLVNPVSDTQLYKILVNQTFSIFRENVTASNAYTTAQSVIVSGDNLVNNYSSLSRWGASYDTSAVDTGTVNSVKFGWKSTSKTNSLGSLSINATTFTPSDYTTVNRTANFNKFGNTSLAGWNYADVSTTNYNNASLATSIVNKTGHTALGLRLSPDVNNIESQITWVTGKLSSAFRPNVISSVPTGTFLEIDYTPAAAPDTTPPGSITGLTNTTPNCGNITWSWTNPTTSDFNHTWVMKNNVWYYNYSNTTTTALWEGLSNITAYTFSSKTVDIIGNMNLSWVNKTANTTECSLAVPPTPTPTPTPMPTIAGSLEIPLCGRQDFFFYNASSEIAGHRLMKNYPELDGQREIVSASISSSSGEVTLGTWILNSGVTETKMMAPGSWDFRPYFTSSADAGLTSSHIRAFNMSPTGVKTYFWFGNAIISDIGKTTIPTEYDIHYSRRNYTSFFVGDRLGIQINVSTDNAAARTVTMGLAGNTNASMFSNAYWLCPVTTASTPTPPSWQPLINPTTDTHYNWWKLLTDWWWLPLLILAMIILFTRR